MPELAILYLTCVYGPDYESVLRAMKQMSSRDQMLLKRAQAYVSS